MDEAIILIDGGYLNRILRNNFSGLDLDYLKFCDVVCEILKVNRLSTYYYNCLPFVRADSDEDKKRLSRVQKFLGNLRRLPRFEVKLGKLQFVGGKFRQKMVDVLMSLDIVKKSIGSKVRHIVLVAGDADFVPAIRIAKESDTIIHLFYYPSSVHNELLDEIDEPHMIDKNIIDGCRK